MNKKILLLISCLAMALFTNAQTDSLAGFDTKHFSQHLAAFKGTEMQRLKYIERVKRSYINKKYNLIKPKIAKPGSNTSPQSFCANVDFESGNTSGWSITGSSELVSGAATDIYGNFATVYPGGNYSLKLGTDSVTTGNFTSTATRTISVAPANAFFSVHYALDFLDFPHDSASTSKFSVQFFDVIGNLIPCPSFESCHYIDGLGNPQNVNMNSAQQTWGSDTMPYSSGPGMNLGSQNFPVTYQDWHTTTADLSPYVGTNVTCVITSTWCLYQYDWAYCYIDADCNSSPITASNPICAGGSTVLLGPPGMASYSWTGPVSGGAQNLTTSIAGDYTLTTTSTNSCIIGGSFTYIVSYTTPGSYPWVSIVATKDSACSGIADTLTASGASTYTWSSNALSATTNTVSVSPVNTQTYTVTAYDSTSHCTDTTTKIINVISCSTDINQLSEKSTDLKFYPNPANGILTVEYKFKNAELFVTDILGNKIMQLQAEKEIFNIDISQLSKGVYFLNVKSSEGNFTKKFIVQR
jgi:hypothetical protein